MTYSTPILQLHNLLHNGHFGDLYLDKPGTSHVVIIFPFNATVTYSNNHNHNQNQKQ